MLKSQTQSQAVKLCTSCVLAVALLHLPTLGLAQTASNSLANTTVQQYLSTLTQSAWQKQAEYLSRDSQLALIDAKNQLNKRSTPESGAIDLGASRASQGGRGFELAYTTPLWLRNERQFSSQQLASEAQALDTKLAVSKWRLAGQVRELYWVWRMLHNDVTYADQHADSTSQLLADVKNRLVAGDMTAADLKQAEIAQLSSQLALAEARNSEAAARLQLSAATGMNVSVQLINNAMVDAETTTTLTMPEKHPIIANIDFQLSQLEVTKQLAIVQSRSRPEFTVGVGRDRGASGEQFQTNLRMGVKLALGSADNRSLAQQTVQTRMDELRAEQVVEAQKLIADQKVAQQRLNAIEQQVTLAQRRSEAANALLAMVQKAFSLGEFDLPTRIRAAAEANEAKRQLAKTSFEKAAAASAYKQALGLLP